MEAAGEDLISLWEGCRSSAACFLRTTTRTNDTAVGASTILDHDDFLKFRQFKNLSTHIDYHSPGPRTSLNALSGIPSSPPLSSPIQEEVPSLNMGLSMSKSNVPQKVDDDDDDDD